MNKGMMISKVVAGSHFNLWLSLALVLLLVFVILTAVHLYYSNTESYKLGLQLPGPPPIPLLGNALMAIRLSGHEIYLEALRLGSMYGHVGRGFLGYKVLVFLSDPRDVELILNSKKHLTKPTEYKFFQPWLGDGLLISKGDKWRSHRKLIAPAFHQYVLKSFMGAFNRNSWRVVKQMQSEVGKEFDVHDYMSGVTVDILLETAMGHRKTHNDREGFDYAMAVLKLCEIIQHRQFTFYLRPDFLFNWSTVKAQHDRLIGVIHNLTEKVFRSKKEAFKRKVRDGNAPTPIYPDLVKKNETEMNQANSAADDNVIIDDTEEPNDGMKNRLAFLDLMIESTYCGADITDQEIKEEVDTIMFEGHDTTAACASFVLSLLACHTDVQDRVFEEQKAIFGDIKRAATFADATQMQYLERVILETIRIYPPVPVIAREVEENVPLASIPLTIPAGATVVIGTLKIHRREDYYDDPLVFNPDRWIDMKHKNFYAFIPFSAGPRSCVGRKYAMLKLKILLSTVCRNFIIQSKCTEADFKLQGDIILKRSDGFRIQIVPRTSSY